MERRALVVIDMLRDFVAEEGSLYCGPAASALVEPVAAEIQQARREGAPVIYVCDRHRPDDPEFAMFPPHCVEGTPGAEVVAALAPRPDDRITAKRRFSGFFGTDLDLSLRELEVDRLRLVGVCTNICVLYTAADARMRGYRVEVPADKVASFDPEAHRWALGQMEKVLGVRVL
ncbi:MAG: isochorismatase family cysteine hydrolase [Bacillota bacterium]|nr:isochorismatase family cysteine hydrolase [Bacillota bacterium]